MSTRPIEREVLLEGDLFSVERCAWTTADGIRKTRSIVRHPGAVTVVPKLQNGRLMMVKNWRLAVGGPLLEFPAGKLEPGEHPQDAACRELQEETGCRCLQVKPIGTFFTSPGFADELMHVFAAEAVDDGVPAPEVGEEVEPASLTVDQFENMIAAGQIQDGKTLAAWQLWKQWSEAH